MNRKHTLLISFVILVAAVGVVALIFTTEPTATQAGASRDTAMPVDVAETQRDDYQPLITVTGNVEPSREVMLSPRVSGEVVELSANFTPGGYVQEDELLIQIDSTDYVHALQQQQSELKQATADLNIEMGNQSVARQELDTFGDTLSEFNRSLMLREPQLQTAESAVESARAGVEQAQLDLRRTTIRAPFDAHIIYRAVNKGSVISPGEPVARLVGLDSYWIEATVPLSHLSRLSFPEEGERGAEVRIRHRTAWEPDHYRTGYLYKQIGALGEETRMARILIEVPDPHSRQPENRSEPILLLNSFVEAEIPGDTLEEVIRIDRDYLRQDETVWVMEDEKLQIREVTIAFRDSEYAYITGGLQDGDKVITTNLSTVTEGASLRRDTTANGDETGS